MKNIFTAQKTVLALAVAGLMSSGAFAAADSQIDNITIGENGALVITGNAHNTAASAVATGNVTTGKDEGTIGKGQFAATTTGVNLTMNGGTLTVKADNSSTTGNNGALFLQGLAFGDYTNTINVDATSRDSTIVAKKGLDTSNGNVVLNFLGQPAEGSTSTAKIRTDDNQAITLGGDDALTTINVAAGTTARIQAGEDKGSFGAVTLNNIKLANEGKLTFKGNTISLASAYQNTGAGTTVFDSTGQAAEVSNDFTSTTVGLVGADTAGYADIFTNGVKVTDGNFTAQKIDILNGKTMTVAEGADAEQDGIGDQTSIWIHGGPSFRMAFWLWERS